MSEKINLISIISGHLTTLRNAGNDRPSKIDITTFYLLPFIAATLSACGGVSFSSDVVNIFVNASAIFTGLLLNLLILVHDQKSKIPPVNANLPGWEKNAIKNKILDELYYNISYATLISLLLLVFSVLHLCIKGSIFKFIYVDANINLNLQIDFSIYITTTLLIFCGLNLIFTIFMVLKRIYSLLADGT